MGHGRETTLSLNLKIVCILIFITNCIYITGASWHMVFEFEFKICGLSRSVTGGRGGRGERRKKRWRGRKAGKNVYHIFCDLEYESLQGVSSYCAKCLPCDLGSEVAWTTTALQ